MLNIVSMPNTQQQHRVDILGAEKPTANDSGVLSSEESPVPRSQQQLQTKTAAVMPGYMRSKSPLQLNRTRTERTAVAMQARTAYPVSRVERPKLMAADYAVSAGAFRKTAISRPRGSV